MMALIADTGSPTVCHQVRCREMGKVDQLKPWGVGCAVIREHTVLVCECCEKVKDMPMQLETDKGGEKDPEHLQRAETNCC